MVWRNKTFYNHGEIEAAIKPSRGFGEEMTDTSAVQPRGEGKYILSIAPDGSVIQFNPDCERLTGFSRADILHKGFQELIPAAFQAEWEALLSDMKASLKNCSFELPVQTRSHEQVMVEWNTFLVTDPNSGLQSVCLIGETQTPVPAMQTVTLNPIPESSPMQSVPVSEPHVVCRPAVEQQEVVDHSRESFELLQAELRSMQEALASMNLRLEDLTRTMTSSQTILDRLPEELQTMTASIQELRSQSHERIVVEKPRQEPVDHARFGFHKKEKTAQAPDAVEQRNQELESREQQIREKERELNLRFDEFYLWKEKLKTIEENIERRQAALESEPTMITPVARESRQDEAAMQEYLSTLSEGAVVVQRGIIKQVNTSFASLVGYDVGELVEKSLFDFIAIEGLGRIEQYYLDRLKGESLAGYSTVFLKKDHTPVAVDVQIKTIRSNGEAAEVLLVNPPQQQ
jgi:PAS domain S-box-containing protein